MNLLIALFLTAITASETDANAASMEARVAQAIAVFEPFPPKRAHQRLDAEHETAPADKGRAARIARDLVPDGNLPLDRVEWFCNLVLRLALTNPTLVYAQIEANPLDATSTTAPGVRLTGAASAPCVTQALTTALHAVGIEQVINEIRVLPDRARLGDELFGACRVSKALTRTAPDERAGVQTELLFGEPVYLLDRDGDHLLLQAGDGYWGWVGCDAIATMNAQQFIEYTEAPEFAVSRDIDTSGVRIPRGARVRLASANGENLKVIVPRSNAKCAESAVSNNQDENPSAVSANSAVQSTRLQARILPVPRDALEPADDSPAAKRRVLAALDLLGTPYVFGGRSPAGLDCSGLLTNVAARGSEPIARDANQQALAGRLSATAWFRDGLRAGDHVFFIDPSGKIYHTGIAISPMHILHAAPPGVQIGTFVRGDRLYDERIDRDFYIAKRP